MVQKVGQSLRDAHKMLMSQFKIAGIHFSEQGYDFGQLVAGQSYWPSSKIIYQQMDTIDRTKCINLCPSG